MSGGKCPLFNQCRVTIQSGLRRNFFTGDEREIEREDACGEGEREGLEE